MPDMSILDRLLHAGEAAGLAFRGAFNPRPQDSVPDLEAGRPAATLALFGFAGRGGFDRFAQSAEFTDGAPDPLDRWSRRILDAMAREVGGRAVFPFGGPPYHPFQRWAARADDVRPSPLGLFIHPRWGLWHSYRGGVVLAERLPLPEPERPESGPCDACEAKPCLDACPVGAFSATGFDVGRCAAHLAGPDGRECMEAGCLARRACPVGRQHAHDRLQARFTMQAFRRNHPCPPQPAGG